MKVNTPMSPNLHAFLDMIAFSELGPELLAESDNGYDVVVGSRPGHVQLFAPYDDHPWQRVTLTIHGKLVISTAAGRYQILGRYFDTYRMQLGLPDFGHDAQDLIAIQMIRECHAMQDIEDGAFAVAVGKCRSRWASLPGAGYGQHEQQLADLTAAYTAAGGALA
jgi:muramidase (phage lysozyme)